MAYDDGLIYLSNGGGVSIYDVQQALGVQSNDLGTLCTSNQINPFAKWKPFRHNDIVHYSGTYTADNRDPRLTDLKAVIYGTNVIQCGTLTFEQNYDSHWSHVAPRGANYNNSGHDEFYRLADFVGYQHNKWPLGVTESGKALQTIFNGYLRIPGAMVSELDNIYFNMQCCENEDLDSYLNLLYPADFAGLISPYDLSRYYVGIAILDGLDSQNAANHKVWVYSDPYVGDFISSHNGQLYIGVSTQIPSNITGGLIRIVPVLTSVQTTSITQSGWTDSLNGTIVILDAGVGNHNYLEANVVAQSVNLKTDVSFTIGESSVQVGISIKNLTGSQVTVQKIECYLLSEAAEANEPDYEGVPAYKGMGAGPYIQQNWNTIQGDVHLHDWTGASENPDPLAARYYGATFDFENSNNGSRIIGNNQTVSWSKTFGITTDGYGLGDGFGPYSNGVWLYIGIDASTSSANSSFMRTINSRNV